jgi:HK97 family phage portal protein
LSHDGFTKLNQFKRQNVEKFPHSRVAYFQNFVDKYIWPIKKSSWPGNYDSITDINGSLLESIFATDNAAGEIVTVPKALRNSTVFSSINVRGNTIASLPCNVIQESANKKTVLVDHPAYYLLAHQPNGYMTAANFWKVIMLHVDAWGNAYAHITRDSRRNPVALDIWEPWAVTVEVKNGVAIYTYNGETVFGRDVLHYRFYTWDGLMGRSPIIENRDTIGMAMKLDRYSAILMGKKPPGVLSYEGNLTPEQKSENKKEWGSGSAGDVKILSARWKYQPIMTPADESAFAVSRRQNKTDLLGIWQMPPQFVQDLERSTFSNAEQMDLVYAKHTIVPPCRNIELENNMKLFKEQEKANTYTKFNLNGLLRGDIAARQAFYQAMVNGGIMSRNEARGLEDMNPYKGGDDFLVQGAMILADKLREMMDSKLIPSAPAPKNTKVNGHVLN